MTDFSVNRSDMADTLPHRPVQLMRRMRPRRGMGCMPLILVGLLVMLFLCVGASALYIAFPPPAVNILVMGLDARDGEGWVTRTDSIMLVGVNPARLRVSLLSIPRDLFIDVPGYGMQRINTVNVLGEQAQRGTGPDLLGSSIGANFGVTPTRYVRLNFAGFVALIDAIGGIDIDVPYRIVDYDFPTTDNGTITVTFEPGLQHMDGERALIYARTRHADDDYHRAERQQQVVSAIASKLINPIYWGPAVVVLNQYSETDLNLWDMFTLAPTVLVNVGRFDQLVIDRQYIVAANGYTVPNYSAIAPWIHERFN